MVGPQAQIRFQLGAAASGLRLRFYSPAWVLMAESRHDGAWQAGWNSLSADIEALPAGLCYAVLQADDGRRQSLPRPPLRLYRLR